MSESVSKDKPLAKIDKWVVWNDRLLGTISGHPRQIEFRGNQQVTSRLVKEPPYDFREGDLAETENTVYKLGVAA